MKTITICDFDSYSLVISEKDFIRNLLKLDVKLNLNEPFIFNFTCYNSVIDFLIREAHRISFILVDNDTSINVAIDGKAILQSIPNINITTLKELNKLFKKLSVNSLV